MYIKILTTICPNRQQDDDWYWEVEIISTDTNYVLKRFYRKFDFLRQSMKSINGYPRSPKGYIYGSEYSLERAEECINEILNNIKEFVINYKNEIKKEKLWEWDDNNNEFKEIKGGF